MSNHASLPIAPPGRPRVPLAPVLSGASFRRGGAARLPSVLDAGEVRLVTSGRIAIALALREMGVKAGDTVLVPAYHSLSMVPPVLWCGAAPCFYRVGADAAADLVHADTLLDPSVKAIMVTHYFGFPQDMAKIRAWCDRHGLQLLEDCAHCFFGEAGDRPVGAWGDYAIASSMKFFPNYEGGCLVSASRSLAPVALRSAGAGFELKVALTALENSFAYGRLPLLAALMRLPLAAKAAVWRMLKARRPAAAAVQLAPASSDSSSRFDTDWLDKYSSWFSRRMLALAGRNRIVERRRANYLKLEAALGRLSGARPLFGVLPDGACPWLFPMLGRTARSGVRQTAARRRTVDPLR
jgi:perosamine synthetase